MLGSEPPVAGSFSSWTDSLVVYNYEMQHQYPDDPSKQVSFKDILLEVPAGTKTDYEAANLWKEFTVNEYEASFIQGDVNDDDKVTIADVTALVNVILGKATAPASGVADVNGDHKVTIADVTALVNIILGK